MTITINSLTISGSEITIGYENNEPPTFPILGAWGETIECGDASFDVISLSSALPQDYINGSYNKFFGNGKTGNIQGWYENIYNNGKTYFISIGGSNATSTGWMSFLNILNDEPKLQNFMNACKCRNITGIDWDIKTKKYLYIIKNE